MSNATEHLALRDREARTLPRQPVCAELACTEGTIWVTASGDPNDHLLARGQRLMIGDRRGVVVSAFGASELRLTRPAACVETTRGDLGLAGAGLQ